MEETMGELTVEDLVKVAQESCLQAANRIDYLEAAVEDLTHKLAARDKRDESIALASTLVEQGALEEQHFEAKVAELQEADDESFTLTKKAVEVYGSGGIHPGAVDPNHGHSVGQVFDDPVKTAHLNDPEAHRNNARQRFFDKWDC